MNQRRKGWVAQQGEGEGEASSWGGRLCKAGIEINADPIRREDWVTYSSRHGRYSATPELEEHGVVVVWWQERQTVLKQRKSSGDGLISTHSNGPSQKVR